MKIPKFDKEINELLGIQESNEETYSEMVSDESDFSLELNDGKFMESIAQDEILHSQMEF